MTTPSPDSGAWSEARVEQFVASVLRVGVIVSAVITAIGGVMLLFKHGSTVADYHQFAGEPVALRSMGGVIQGVAQLDPLAIVQFGLIVLIATPIARVALALVAFMKQRDRLYVWVTTIVLVVLAFSLLFGDRL